MVLISAANVAKGCSGWKCLTLPLLCLGHCIWKWLFMWVVWRVILLGRTKEGSIPFCCAGQPWTSGLLWCHGICSAVSACASPVRLQTWEGGNRRTTANDERYALSSFCWEGSAVQVLWGSNWSAKHKELTCHGTRERNENINGRREFTVWTVWENGSGWNFSLLEKLPLFYYCLS